jgi:hypothetical protein
MRKKLSGMGVFTIYAVIAALVIIVAFIWG